MAARICKIWTRGFARKAKTKNADSLKSWNAYRQELKQLNNQFKSEWIMKEKEKQEAASAQAVREQRLEKIEEERNLKANEMELYKMEKNRYICACIIQVIENQDDRLRTTCICPPATYNISYYEIRQECTPKTDVNGTSMMTCTHCLCEPLNMTLVGIITISSIVISFFSHQYCTCREIMNLKLREQQELDREKGAERRMQFDSIIQRKRVEEVERQKVDMVLACEH